MLTPHVPPSPATDGKTGAQFTQSIRDLNTSVNEAYVRTPNSSALLPVAITEHAVRTSGTWTSTPSTTDANYEASRLASQLIRAVTGALVTTPRGGPQTPTRLRTIV